MKVWLEETLELDRDALHIYAGILVQLIVAVFCRRSLASLWPWITVLMIAGYNEYSDFGRSSGTPESFAFHKAEAIHDMWITMLLPTLLLLMARFWPSGLVGKLGDDGASGDR